MSEPKIADTHCTCCRIMSEPKIVDTILYNCRVKVHIAFTQGYLVAQTGTKLQSALYKQRFPDTAQQIQREDYGAARLRIQGSIPGRYTP
jgi:hypothetical protein